jgi:hypothetical protein
VEWVFSHLSLLLTAMFLIGLAGCVLVIPIVAYKLFSVLFEDDAEEENGKDPHPAQIVG